MNTWREYEELDTWNGKRYEKFTGQCGCDKFSMTVAFHEPYNHPAGPIEEHYLCKCGKQYIREYGEVRYDPI